MQIEGLLRGANAPDAKNKSLMMNIGQSRAAAMDWYLNPVAADRCENQQATAHKTSVAERSVQNMTDLLTLPDDVIEHAFTKMPLEELRRLSELSARALSRVVPVGKPMPQLQVDIMMVAATPTMASIMEEVPKAPSKPVTLNPKKWIDLPLEAKTEINHNTLRLRFTLPTENLGLPVGMHIFLKSPVKIDGKSVMRAYTPVGFGPGYVEFMYEPHHLRQPFLPPPI